MSDLQEPAAASSARATTAGGLLRQARQAQGLHIAALAAAIKVLPRKLELLESDQFDQLPDATFTRALAHTVCRTLKIDPAPVLALLPPPRGSRLEHVAEGLNTPFRERPGRLEPKEWVSIASPTLWIVALLIIATAVVYLMPPGWLSFAKARALQRSGDVSVSAPAASGVESITLTAGPQSATPPVDVSPPPEPQTSESATPPSATTTDDGAPASASEAPVTGVVQVHTTAQSWIEVTDSRGKVLIARLVEANESLGFDGTMPFKVRIGNAGATQLTFKGKPFELASFTRDNVARLELK
jgi:cytoskeleton protein RodZ